MLMQPLEHQRPSPPAGPGAAVATRGLTKRFPGVVANDHVDFEAAIGEVHAILGENGAGKTTLAHLLSGLLRPDAGRLFLYGREVELASPREAIDAGVGIVHQHFRLVERFTVAENIILGDNRRGGRRFRIEPRAVESQVRALGERYRLPVDPSAFVWQLSVGEQQRVEILNALYQDARILILDEPTAVLTPDEARTLFGTLRQMAAEGRTVVFISHKLHEVKAVSDRVTVMRSGRAIATVETTAVTPPQLASLMVGRALGIPARRAHAPGTATVLELDNLWVDGDRGVPAVCGVSLSLREGEIVAIAGVAGNGQRELAETVTGLRPHTRGRVVLAGRPLPNGDARAAFESGVGYVPEDRLGTAVAPGLPIAMNVELRSYRNCSRGPLLRLGRMRADAEEAIRAFDIKASGPAMTTAHLSGGNLQKVVIARELAGPMKVLVAASPTRGLDVAALEAVHERLLEAAAAGTAVLLISEDLDELLSLGDRILVMYGGRLHAVAERENLQEIGLLMAGDATAGAAA
jgi:simple sugar transport system ATP-binding protein